MMPTTTALRILLPTCTRMRLQSWPWSIQLALNPFIVEEKCIELWDKPRSSFSYVLCVWAPVLLKLLPPLSLPEIR